MPLPPRLPQREWRRKRVREAARGAVFQLLGGGEAQARWGQQGGKPGRLLPVLGYPACRLLEAGRRLKREPERTSRLTNGGRRGLRACAQRWSRGRCRRHAGKPVLAGAASPRGRRRPGPALWTLAASYFPTDTSGQYE